MVRQVIEAIEQLHAAGSMRRDEPQSETIEKALAGCLQQLRAIVALEARDPFRRRPRLQVV
jgi:hypothetical protein